MVRAFISLSEKLFRYILIFCNKSNSDYTQNAKSNFRFTLPLAHQKQKAGQLSLLSLTEKSEVQKIGGELVLSADLCYNEANEKPPSKREGDRVSGGRSLRDFRFVLTSL